MLDRVFVVSESMTRPMRSLLAATALGAACGAVAACTPSEGPGSSETGTTTSDPGSSTTSSSRAPAGQRAQLAGLSADRMCGLVSVDTLRRAAFEVREGKPREVGFDPPVRGCEYEAVDGNGAVLVASQPDGWHTIGNDPVRMGNVTASRTSHANDCTVYADVSGATLQVVVSGQDSSGRCEAAETVTEHVVSNLAL